MRKHILQAQACLVAFAALVASVGYTQTITFPDSPLQTAASISVKPNLLFMLDDSGSMNFQYTPDQISSDSSWNSGDVYERMCYDSGDNYVAGRNNNPIYDDTGNILGYNLACQPGDVPFMAPGFNSQYYNPAIRYRPGLKADGTSYASQDRSTTSAWTSVTTDAYGVSKYKMETPGTSSNTADLTQFPDRVWCDDPDASTASNTRCKLNTTGYDYPNAGFPYGRDSSSNIKYRYGQPYYWTIPKFEYCTNSTMKDCIVANAPITTGGKTYNVPSTLRYCKYTGGTNTLEVAKLFLNDCQAKFDLDNKYTYPRFLGKALPANAVAGAISTIKFATPNVSQDLQSITVDGNNILVGTFFGYTDRTVLATAVANAINSKNGTPEFRACAGGTACNTLLGITGSVNDTVYIYPTGASGSTVRETGLSTNDYGTPVVTGSAAGAGTRSKATINVTALGSTGNPPVGGVSNIAAGGVNLLTSALTFNTANTPSDVAAAIAAGINGGSQSANFGATAAGSVVTIERKVSGQFYDGTAITFDYSSVPRAAAATSNVTSATSLAKTIQVRFSPNAGCSGAGTYSYPALSLPSGGSFDSVNEVAAAIRTHLTNNAGSSGMTVSGSNAAITLTSGTDSNENGWFLCFAASNSTVSNAAFSTLGRSSMSGKLTATAFAGGAATGVVAATVTPFTGGIDDHPTSYRTDIAQWSKTVIISTGVYPKAASRTDCTGATCSYDEEMTNFANWYTYYRTRMQSMKTAGGQAFASITDNFRVGFTTINDTKADRFIKIRDFTATQKSSWYTQFYSVGFNGGTPLRQATSRAGRIFSGINPFGTSSKYEDPIQFSCQQNFLLLTTDGYWNEPNDGDEDRIVKEGSAGRVDNADGGASVAAPFFDGGPGFCPAGASSCLGSTCPGSKNDTSKFSSCNTLADVSYWFATTDLRRSELSNCSNQSDNTNTNNLCTNDVKTSSKDSIRTQHMNMFALGLGVEGILNFQDDYETAGAGDFADIRSGTKNWPQVKNLHPTAVDDLWHAAVNGRGKYFSAKDPDSLSKGLKSALAEVNAQGGAGAAAATSNLEPVAGDNFVYVGSYQTVKWTGNVEARQIDLQSGDVSTAAQWCVENVLDPVTNNISCTGTMNSLVQAGTDTRVIYAFDSTATDKLKPFTYNSLTATQKAMFATTGLSQYSTLDDDAKAAATPANLVDYLRGQYQYEARSSNTAKAFRARERILADVIGSQPIYVKKPAFSYNDTGYAAFVTSNLSRSGTVYIGANDGMLHAFDANTGVERWAYVPSAMLPKMRQLADVSYPTNHRFFVDGSPKVGDVYTGSAWKTILVGGYSSGGIGYFAMDITDPSAPKALWEFPPSTETDAGYGFSSPIITKLANGTWVVIVSSGYNNSGQGYMYVLNAMTGAQIRKISTGVGTLASPSGLGKLTGFAPGMPFDNTTQKVYGGDLQGNLWRFDPSTGALAKIAVLKDSGGSVQPITSKVEIVSVDSQTLLYVGTGKYLETGDLSTSQSQTFYGIRDTFDADGTVTDPRVTFNQVTLADTTATGGGFDRRSTGSAGNIKTGRGFYADLPVSGERVNIDPQFVNGTVVLLSNVPSNTACTAGGVSYITFFDYQNGNVLTGSGDFAAAIVVGFVTVRVGNSFIPLITRADSPNPQRGAPVPTSSGDTRYRGRRVSWKELSVD